MNPLHRPARALLCACALAASLAACDDDPTNAALSPLTLNVVRDTPTDSVIARSEPIKIVFSDDVDPRSALDPANFIVTDRCTGLRVAGSLRLAADTLVFTPSRALQFLTPLDVRVQNVLTVAGRALPNPVVFSLYTEAPPVQDVSWRRLDSPTNDAIAGVSFVDQTTGYVGTFGGAIYRTQNGGQSYAAQFKDPDLILTTGVRTAGRDTIFITAAPSFGGTTFTTAGLFRSVDGGRTFQALFTENPADMTAPALYRPAGAKPVVLIGGNRNELSAWRYDTETNTIDRFGPIANQIGYRANISPNGTHAALAGEDFEVSGDATGGVLYGSTTGGRTWTRIPLPAGSFSLFDVAFTTNTQGIAVGLRSGIYRFDAAANTSTRLGAAQGIPQTDSTANSITTYNLIAVTFAPGGQVGWAVGYIQRRTVGEPDDTRGLILQTVDGGQNWTRQAVQGTGENGLGFAPVLDVYALATNFAVVGGQNGFLAIRTAESSQSTGYCSFADQPIEP